MGQTLMFRFPFWLDEQQATFPLHVDDTLRMSMQPVPRLMGRKLSNEVVMLSQHWSFISLPHWFWGLGGGLPPPPPPVRLSTGEAIAARARVKTTRAFLTNIFGDWVLREGRYCNRYVDNVESGFGSLDPCD